MIRMNNIRNSRTYNTIMNSIIGIISSIITILLNFIVRVTIVQVLGDETNGIHNLFQSITNAISLIEAGFSTAMVIHLYKPIKEKDHNETKAILSFYKKIYTRIALVFTIICVIVNIFGIQYLVESSIPINKVRIYFAIYSLITPLDYLTYHKTSILYAEQKNRIRVAVATASELVFRTLQIVSVIVLKQYYIFLVLQIMEKLICNAICAKYVNKRHEYIKDDNTVSVSSELKSSIFKTVKPIFINNISSNIQTSAKSILISILLGNVSNVGYYGNYQLVISCAQLLFSQFGASLTSSFGNLAVEGNKQHMYKIYRKTSFILNSLAIVICAGFICCIQTFILIFFGKRFLLNFSNVIILTIGLFIELLKVPIISVQNAMGLHDKDQIMMIVQTIMAVILGFVFGLKFGMNGILLGLLLPQFMFTLINKGIVINKAAFESSPIDFIRFFFLDIMKGIISVSSCYCVCLFINTGNLIIDLISKGIISIIISFLWLFILSFRSQYFKDVVTMIYNVYNNKKRRR